MYDRSPIISSRRAIGMSPRAKLGLAPDFKISRAVDVGDWLFIGGQMDIGDHAVVCNPGDLMSQTVSCMRSIHELLARTDRSLAELAHLQIWYLADSVPDERQYREQILAEFPECRDKLIVLTAVPSFLAPGFEVEIDAMAVKGEADCTTDEFGSTSGVRRGDWVFANSRIKTGSGLLDDLDKTFGKLNASLADVCRLYVAFPDDLEAFEREQIEGHLATAFADHSPAYHSVLLPRTSKQRFAVELEVIANTNSASTVRRHGNSLSPNSLLHWPFPEVLVRDSVAFSSGQYPIDGSGQIVHPNDSAEQARVIMKRLNAALNLCGADLSKLSKLKTYYSGGWSKENWETNLRARMESLSDPGPASAGLDGLLPARPGALLSVDGIAFLDSVLAAP